MIAVAVVGVVVAVLLGLAAEQVHRSNESRLLRQRTREAGAVLTAALPSLQTPLVAAVEVARSQPGADPAVFRRIVEPFIGAGKPYVSASLWRLDVDHLEPLYVVGTPPKLARRSQAEIRAYFERAPAATIGVLPLLDGDDPRLGYAVATSGSTTRFVAYAEAGLPPNRTSVVQSDNAFAGLDDAVYLGTRVDPATLLVASRPDLPLRGATSSDVIPFGDSSLLLVMTPRSQLGGALMAALPWIVALSVLAVTVVAAGLAQQLARGRATAEELAQRNDALFREQRDVALALQHRLLPASLPRVSGIEIGVRYDAGVQNMEVGGDWYDVIRIDGSRALLVVGDVSGRGAEAAAAMGTLRSAMRAYAIEGHSPAYILGKLSSLLDIGRDHQFATVLCADVDVATGTVQLVSAGHLPPIVATDDGGCTIVPTTVGLPVGVNGDSPYVATTFHLDTGSTLFMFTDGLCERRGESIDDGLQRLAESICSIRHADLDQFLSELVERQRTDTSHDDTAILAVRRCAVHLRNPW